jgi:hypothetical protein
MTLKNAGLWLLEQYAAALCIALLVLFLGATGITATFTDFFSTYHRLPGWFILFVLCLLVAIPGSRLLQQHPPLVILAAIYGDGDQWISQSKWLTSQISNNTLSKIRAGNQCGDPCPGIRKRLVVIYSHHGKPNIKTVPEKETFSLP